MMDLGDPEGPIAMLSVSGEDRQLEVHRGAMIGPFKLLSFNRQEITLEWDGRVIHKRVDENGDNAKAAPRAQTDPASFSGTIPGVAPPERPPSTVRNPELGPGVQMTDTIRACQPNDGSPAGAVKDGYRKELTRTLVGASQCLWIAVGK